MRQRFQILNQGGGEGALDGFLEIAAFGVELEAAEPQKYPTMLAHLHANPLPASASIARRSRG